MIESITNNTTLPPGLNQRPSSLDSQQSFASVLSRTADVGDGETPEKKARTGAEQFVSIALVQPILKQLRESSQAPEPFKPNAAERTFRGMYDAQLAQKLVQQSRWPLVDRVARDLLSKNAGPRTDAEPGLRGYGGKGSEEPPPAATQQRRGASVEPKRT